MGASEGRTFTRADPESRRADLIAAVLRLMADGGPEAVTVRAIATEAGLSQGMIRHYFATKEDLVNAAYDAHMANQVRVAEAAEGAGDACDRLARFVVASLTPPVIDPRTVSLWAGFIHMIRRDPAMRATHRASYLRYRDRLEVLIAAALGEAGRAEASDAGTTRALAIACNAVLDGLWLEGGALPEAFAAGEIREIGLTSVGTLLGLDLGECGTPP